MAQNKILPWAQTGTANVLSDADYASDVASGGLYGDGVKTGQASSKQANKTWRQATAPGSGLGQFLVDNLSVDVTDADTPATFSSRIANAVLKLAQISPFNQSWATATGGYRKYAIVSDSSGNFWVSTADQNTTVPGASGAKWQNLFNGYATQSWANSAFVKNNAGTQGGIVALDLDSDGSGRVTFEKTDGSWGALQPAGDYATNSALNSETQRATTAENGLQLSKANLNGGNSYTGAQSIYNAPVVVHNSPNLEHGDWNYSPSLVARTDSRAGVQIFAQDQVDGATAIVLAYEWNAVAQTYWWFSNDGSINNSKKGEVAFESDISNLQNQINGKQAAGDYVTASVYSDDFSTSDSRVINLPYGHRIQAFKTGNVTNGDIVTFPTAFSSIPSAIICQSSRGDWDVWAQDGTWTTTGFTIAGAAQSGGAQPLTVIAIGSK